MTDTKHTPGPLTVNEIAFRGKDGKQYTIKSDYSNRPDGVDFIDAYVNISGYYGAYGPHVFAAAPDLLEACIGLLQVQDGLLMTGLEATRRAVNARAAISKAKGQT